MKHVSSLFVNQVDAKGDILKHPSALDEALRMGQSLVTGPQPSDMPEVVRLFGGLSGESASSGDSL